MQNFIFALNATMPVFLVILLGWFLNRVGILNAPFCKAADQYVFRVALPVSLFQSVAGMDIYSDFNLSFCLFCAFGTMAMFMGVWLVASKLMKEKQMIGAFSQASARSSAAILGLALANNIYGSAGMVPMMIVAAVPLFNICAVIILTFSPQTDERGRIVTENVQGMAMVKKACANVIRNPIIIGILLGIPFALLRARLPEILRSTVASIGGTATPVALLVVGASFSGGEAIKRLKPAMAATIVKLFLLPAIFLPLAALLGFRNSQMVAILIMTGSPTAASCYVMAKQMRGDDVLTSNVIVLATLLSSVSITLWLFVLRAMALI